MATMIEFSTVREKAVRIICEACGVMGEPSPEQHSLIAAFLNDARSFGERDARLAMLISSQHSAPQ
jgi:hypothetical protein